MPARQIDLAYFDERIILYGVIYNSITRIENVRCNLIINEIDPNRMNATISAITANTGEVAKLMNDGGKIKFESETDDRKIILDGYHLSFSISSIDDEMLKFSVDIYEIVEKRSDESISRIHSSFRFSGSQIYNRSVPISTDYKRGLLAGWTGFFPKQLTNEEWVREEHNVSTKIGMISFSPAFLFKNCKIGNQESFIVLEHLLIECSLSGNSLDHALTLSQVKETVDHYLYILSFLENQDVSWHYNISVARDSKDQIVEIKQLYRWIPKRTKKVDDLHYFLRYNTQYRNIHPVIAQSFLSLPDVDKKALEKVIDRFLVASTAQTIDSQIIYWHSCLDILKNHLKGSGKSFTHKLVDSCKKAGVPWLDLFPELTEEAIKGGINFSINKIRNDMLHHGAYTEDYSAAYISMRRTQALCERLILRILNVGYENTGLGFPHV